MTDSVPCTSCQQTAADPRQRCESCEEAVCMRCAAYDEEGALFCPECLADREAADLEQRLGPWW